MSNFNPETYKIAWLGNPEAKILSIRQFRKYIDTLPLAQALSVTLDNWQVSPHVNKQQVNIVNVADWPNPWDLFGQLTFCSNSQILGAFYTLILSEHAKQHHITLVITHHAIDGVQAQIIVNGQIPSDCEILDVITSEDIHDKLGE